MEETLEKRFLEDIVSCRGILLKICRTYCREPEDRDDLFHGIVSNAWKSYSRFEGRSRSKLFRFQIERGFNGATMTGGTIHRRAFGFDAFDCFDGSRRIRSQCTHFTRYLLLRFFVRLPLVGIVTMPATHTQRLAVANIHDSQQVGVGRKTAKANSA